MLASSSALASASSRFLAAARPAVIFLVRALRSSSVRRRFFGSGEGS